MGHIVIKKEVLDIIKSDGTLFGKIANELKISPVSLPRILYANEVKLTQMGVLKILIDHLNLPSVDDVTEELSEGNAKKENLEMQ